MLQLLQTIGAAFEKAKSEITSHLSNLHASVSNAVLYTDDELAAAEKSVFGLVDPTTLTLSAAFAAGAAWASSRVSVAVAQQPAPAVTGAPSGNVEPLTTAPATSAVPAGSTTTSETATSAGTGSTPQPGLPTSAAS